MRVLLDTHILLWALGQPEKLPRVARAMLEAGSDEFFFSAASIWEVAIKAQARRIDFQVSPLEILIAARNSGLAEMPMRADHAARVHQLRLHHKDPFDRILVAQAIGEPVRLLTVDTVLARYSELVQVV